MTRTTRASTKTNTTKPNSKTIKKAEPVSKTPKTTTKAPVAPKRLETAKNKKLREKDNAADKD